MGVEGEFQTYNFPYKQFVGKEDPVSYLVYRDEQDYVLIQAGTAMEAVEKSGIAAPYRIVRNSLLHTSLIHSQVLE